MKCGHFICAFVLCSCTTGATIDLPNVDYGVVQSYARAYAQRQRAERNFVQRVRALSDRNRATQALQHQQQMLEHETELTNSAPH